MAGTQAAERRMAEGKRERSRQGQRHMRPSMSQDEDLNFFSKLNGEFPSRSVLSKE